MTILTSRLSLGQGPRKVVVKDTIDIAGFPTCAGSAALADAPPAVAHAEIVERTLKAGYHIVGKANLHELAFGMTGINAWAGTPENPRYPTLIPGGSSSGSAAAVAAGLADIGIGTDTGGSIRVPAACCGVYGLKPTFGRLSRQGVMPAESSLDCVGPLAHDLHVLIAFMAAIDPHFQSSMEGSAPVLGCLSVSAEQAIWASIEEQLSLSGLARGDVTLPLMAEAFEAAMVIINRETFRACEALLATGKVGADVDQRLQAAAATTDAELKEAERIRRAFTAEVDAVLERHDVLVLPTLPHFPMTVQDAFSGHQDLKISSLARPFNLSGHPALSIPLESQQTLPVSMQLIGRRGDDVGVCKAALQLMGRVSSAGEEQKKEQIMQQHIDKSQWGGEERFDALLESIRSRRKEFEELRHIPMDIIDEFKAIGVYRAMVPATYGGDEKSPAEFLKMVEAISAADGSSGWVASFGMNPAYLAALPEETLKEVWGDSPDIVFAGGIFPPQPAERVDNGFRIKGRWKFASGCMGASLCGVGILPAEEGALPRMAVLPRDQVKVDPTWDMLGMVATGSHDLVVEDAYVPEAWTFVRGGKPNVDTPFFRYPSLSFAAQVLAVTTLGLAREALDIVRAMAGGRKSVTGAPNLGEREYAQIALGKAEAKVRAARAFFYESTDAAWASIQAGGEPSREQINLLRLSTTHLTHECAESIRSVYQISGMTGADNGHPLSRILRDSQLCTQHAFMGEITWKNAGAIFFGHDPLPGYL